MSKVITALAELARASYADEFSDEYADELRELAATAKREHDAQAATLKRVRAVADRRRPFGGLHTTVHDIVAELDAALDDAPAPEPECPNGLHSIHYSLVDNPKCQEDCGARPHTDDAAFWAARDVEVHPIGAARVVYADIYKRDVQAAERARTQLVALYEQMTEACARETARADAASIQASEYMNRHIAEQEKTMQLQARVAELEAELLTERGRAAAASHRVAELERALTKGINAQVTELEARLEESEARVAELEARRKHVESEWLAKCTAADARAGEAERAMREANRVSERAIRSRDDYAARVAELEQRCERLVAAAKNNAVRLKEDQTVWTRDRRRADAAEKTLTEAEAQLRDWASIVKTLKARVAELEAELAAAVKHQSTTKEGKS